jgi:hypothetical protein
LRKELAQISRQVQGICDDEEAYMITAPLSDAANAINKAVLYLDEVV